MAKRALNLDSIEDLPLDYSDYKIKIKKYLNLKWQNDWDKVNEYPNDTTKLYCIKPVLDNWKSSNRKTRHEEIVLARQ